MSQLPNNGMFANQCFQYMFLRVYAKENNLTYQYSWWPGVDLFDLGDTPGITISLPRYNDIPESSITESPVIKNFPKDVDLRGYFQYHTSYYRPYKDFIREIFTPKKYLNDQMIEVKRSLGKKIVGVHFRRGDYLRKGHFFMTETSWVKDALKDFDLSDYIVYIASEGPGDIIPDFAGYNTYSALNYTIDCPFWDHRIRKRTLNQFFADFWMLMNCDILLISNSTFSFMAAMLNTHCSTFLRPHYSLKGFIPFDPWDSEPLFRPQ